MTLGEIKKSPVSNPHGPLEMPNGELLWVGRPFDKTDGDYLKAYIQDKNGDFHAYFSGLTLRICKYQFTRFCRRQNLTDSRIQC